MVALSSHPALLVRYGQVVLFVPAEMRIHRGGRYDRFMTTGHLFLQSRESSEPSAGILARRPGNLIQMQKPGFAALAPNISAPPRIKTDQADVGLELLRIETENLLELFLALDRTVVEFFMHLYGVPQREMSAMRKHNRRLHAAVRERHRKQA